MPKGYVFAQTDVFNQAGMERYRANAEATIKAHGGRYLVRGGDNPDIIEGTPNANIRTVILEFPSRDDAMAWYNSAGYQDLLQDRLKSAHTLVWVMTGYDG